MIPIRAHAVAGAAYARVDARRDGQRKKEYGALAHKLPGMILQNGLAQATGFLIAKNSRSRPEHMALIDDLNAVLREAGAVSTTDGSALHDLVIRSDLAGIVDLTRRSLEVSGWIKRYVQGVLRVDATGNRAADDDTGPSGDAR